MHGPLNAKWLGMLTHKLERGRSMVAYKEDMRLCYINLGFVGPCIFTHSNESTKQMQKLVTGLLFVV
jgi:hypothetical protein